MLRASSTAEARQFASTWYASPISQRFTPLYKGGRIVPAAYAGSTRAVSLYHLTRLWAQALYDRLPNLDGIIYESHQVAGDCVALYQQEKTGTTLFTIEDDPQLIREGDARELLLREARKAGVSVDFGEGDDDDDTET